MGGKAREGESKPGSNQENKLEIGSRRKKTDKDSNPIIMEGGKKL